jgi:hypothetical protein
LQQLQNCKLHNYLLHYYQLHYYQLHYYLLHYYLLHYYRSHKSVESLIFYTMNALYVIIPAAITIFILLFPDIFPKCYLCDKKKLWFHFKIREFISLKPGYGSSKSVCKKCCSKYNIDSRTEMERVRRIKRKAMLDFLARP